MQHMSSAAGDGAVAETAAEAAAETSLYKTEKCAAAYPRPQGTTSPGRQHRARHRHTYIHTIYRVHKKRTLKLVPIYR